MFVKFLAYTSSESSDDDDGEEEVEEEKKGTHKPMREEK